MKKITKASIIRELRGLWNRTKEVNGIKIRRRAWEDNSWQIVDSLDFDNCNVVESFYYQADLADYILKLIRAQNNNDIIKNVCQVRKNRLKKEGFIPVITTI